MAVAVKFQKRMNLPTLPELPSLFEPLPSLKSHLIAVKRSLEKACQEIDSQLQALERCAFPANTYQNEPASASGQRLFEIPPTGFEPQTNGHSKAPADEAETRMVMEATEPTALDPDLEQATLEELNSALSKAFVQMSSRVRW